MLGNTHLMYGFILGELMFSYVAVKSNQQNKYNRPLFWLLGMVGSYFPDFDGLSGIGENLLFRGDSWGIFIFERYHRHFSHSLGFLIVPMILLFSLILVFKSRIKKEYSLPTEGNLKKHPYGQFPAEKDTLSIIIFFIIFFQFFLFNETTKFYIFFSILISLIFFAWSFIRSNQQLYGITFFSGILLHHLCDFIQCDWNPFGPWDWQNLTGLFLYCSPAVGIARYWILFSVFEITPHLIVILQIRKILKQKRLFEELARKNTY